jgi:predicted dehydrogenase
MSHPQHTLSSAARSTRRRFLQAAVGSVAVPYFVPRSVLAAPGRRGANDRLQIGVIGTGNRVRWLLTNWANAAEMNLVALADCSADKMHAFIHGGTDYLSGQPVPGVKDMLPEAQSCRRYEDYREMLDREKLDGVFVTTPTHGRVLPCIHACQAGVDIYAEKPVSLTIEEGQALAAAVTNHGRVFQSGTQARSIAVNDWAVKQLQAGRLGSVQRVLCPNYYGPVDYAPSTSAVTVPAGMNWDLWCNQAPLFPYDAKIAARLEDGWAPYRPFDGGGERWGLTGFGTHTFDQLLWALGRDTESPVEVRPHTPGDPDCAATLRFADGLEIEMMTEIEQGPAFGGVFSCSEGRMEINRGRLATNPADLAAELPEFESPHTAGVSHVQDWLNCIRSRQRTRCPIDVAHRQTTICHMINVARDLGRPLRYDPDTDRFVGDDEANAHASVTRPRRRGYEMPA